MTKASQGIGLSFSQGWEGDVLDLLELRTFIVEEQLRQNTKHHRGSSWPFDGETRLSRDFGIATCLRLPVTAL